MSAGQTVFEVPVLNVKTLAVNPRNPDEQKQCRRATQSDPIRAGPSPALAKPLDISVHVMPEWAIEITQTSSVLRLLRTVFAVWCGAAVSV